MLVRVLLLNFEVVFSFYFSFHLLHVIRFTFLLYGVEIGLLAIIDYCQFVALNALRLLWFPIAGSRSR